MSVEFSSEEHIKHARKEHLCDLCGNVIEKGSSYLIHACKADGYFQYNRYHHDCELMIEFYIDNRKKYKFTQKKYMQILKKLMGGIKMELINGNCMDVDIPKCRLLLTDIPYEEVSRDSNGLRKLDKEQADIATFVISSFLKHIYDSFDICIIFCGQNQISNIFNYFNNKQKEGKGTVRQLVWCKSNPSPMNGEYIYLSGIENAVWFKKKGTGKLNSKCKKNWFIHSTGSSKFHPTEKNHKLLQELILDNTKEGDLIVDTCMGSGSTGIVALENKRKFFGIELDENYFKIAKERINNTIYEENLFLKGCHSGENEYTTDEVNEAIREKFCWNCPDDEDCELSFRKCEKILKGIGYDVTRP